MKCYLLLQFIFIRFTLIILCFDCHLEQKIKIASPEVKYIPRMKNTDNSINRYKENEIFFKVFYEYI